MAEKIKSEPLNIVKEHSFSNPVQEECGDGPTHLTVHKSSGSTPDSIGQPMDNIIKTPDSFKELILNQSAHTMVSLAPILLLINGLPHSGKSEAISKLLKAPPLNITSPVHPLEHGLSFYELAAVAVPEHTSLSKLDYIETKSDDCYLYVLKSALTRHDKLLPTPHIKYQGQYRNKFQSEILNDHLRHTFYQLQDIVEKMNPNWERCVSSGIALINIWDIGLSPTIYHFLPALSGLLYNSYSWLFFDLERDGPDFDKLPGTGKIHLMKWKSRINYLLRAAKLNENIKHPLGEAVCCSIFATCKGTSLPHIVNDELRSKLANTASKLGVKELVDTHNITIINPSDETNCVRVLKAAADKLVFERLGKKIEVPLSFIFLRSLYYEKDDVLYIKRKEVQTLADELKISPSDFKWFCELFTSLGSIIDISLIDKNSQYMILKPNLFLKKLDIIFHTNDKFLTTAGILTSTLAKILFENDHAKVYTDILVSLDLAVSLKSNQIKNDNFLVPSDNQIWYLPDMCINPPLTDTTVPAKNTLRMLRSLDAPQSHLQISFVKKFLKLNPNSKLCVGNYGGNVTKIEAQGTEFDVVYFGYTLEFRINKVDKEIFTQIIQTCHEIMNEKKHTKTKYNFAVMCSRDPPNSSHDHTPDLYELTRDRHILPDKELCECCRHEGRDKEEYLQMWNEVLGEISCRVPFSRGLNGNAILLENADLIAQKMQPPYLNQCTIESFFKKLGDLPETIPGLKDWQKPMMKLIQWENQLTGNDAANPKRALAKKLMEVVYEKDTPKNDRKTLQEIVQFINSEVVKLPEPEDKTNENDDESQFSMEEN